MRESVNVMVKVIVNVTVAATVAFVLGGCSSQQMATEEQGDGCQSPIGFIQEGHSKTGYLQPIAQGGANCEQGEITCRNGQWTGAYINPSCTRQR